MTARAAVQTLLSTDEILISLGFGEVLAANSVDSVEAPRFIIVKWLGTSAVFGSTGKKSLQIWCHDRDKDYTEIGKALKRIQDILTEATHVSGADNWTLTQADWQGEGPDLTDPGYETCTRYADYSVVSRYTPSG